MPREVMIPLSVVESLINTQRDFQKELVERLGFYLKEASTAYRDALNPPLDTGPNVPMSYSSTTDEAEDLIHQLESGQLRIDEIPDSVRKLLSNTEISLDIT